MLYRGQCSYIVEVTLDDKIADPFKDGVEPDVLGNESEEVDRIGEPIELTNDHDWDNEWDQPKRKMNRPSQFGLIGVVFRPDNDEQPWLVQDNRKAPNNEFPCQTKADVLDKIAIILDDMHNPPGKLDRNSDPAEVTVAVTLKASCATSTPRSTSWTCEGQWRRPSKTPSVITKKSASIMPSPTSCRSVWLKSEP